MLEPDTRALAIKSSFDAVSGSKVDPSEKATQLSEGIERATDLAGISAFLGVLGVVVLAISIVRLPGRSEPRHPRPR